jgi:hypothetical protein
VFLHFNLHFSHFLYIFFTQWPGWSSIGTEEANLPHLSATVLDRGLEDLNNLYKTISRKRILSKASAAASTLYLAYIDRRTGLGYAKRSL